MEIPVVTINVAPVFCVLNTCQSERVRDPQEMFLNSEIVRAAFSSLCACSFPVAEGMLHRIHVPRKARPIAQKLLICAN